ncbi:MAG: DoxX family protein [Deltaproteobacteria bacterium]|nr:DoxX family protein [Deltaproteobacteria bacterium]
MNTALWIAQGFTALALMLTGLVKVIVPREKLATRMHWAATWPPGRIKLLGLAEVAGAAGLVLPIATGIAPVLTPIAALCCAVLMGGAVQTHRRLGEGFAPALILGVLCLGIAAGRFAGLGTMG